MYKFLAIPAILALAACSSTPSDPIEPSALTVVTTTPVLGTIVDPIVACGGGTASTVMPVGSDPHDFSPSAEQVSQIVRANIVIANGLDYESGLTSALENAQSDGARVFSVAPELDPREFEDEHGHDEEHKDDDDHGHDDHGHDDHGHGSMDPHVWLDMSRMARAAVLIGEELDSVTGQDGIYTACGEQVADEITEAETEVIAILSTIPADKRVLITDHDALGYFASAYDFEVAGTVIPAGTTLAQPSSSELAALADLITKEGVSVIFVNTNEPTKLAEAVAAETGKDVKIEALYIESPGEPGSGADTYSGMMRTNAQRLADNLGG
jgi:zinc/manganese transport system substrate-binding protein